MTEKQKKPQKLRRVFRAASSIAPLPISARRTK
ncbi:hypothetical protein N185_15070 [Sinorhizobium sp. GW3]|nr:hypothetical protein N185_15070 [Sinorhizobium sp. GW3]